jgi:caspase domain-containing protein
MALIWAEGFTGEQALAPLWRRYAAAAARAEDRTLSAAERGAAMVEAEDARTAYDAAVTAAEAALKQKAASGQARTHALVAGVGRYDSPGIPALTTSVFGAWAFVEWLLTRFQHLDRPLGSVELLLSPSTDLGDWQPSPEAAARLGLAGGAAAETLPVEPATFAGIQEAFERLLKRAGTRQENAAFFYFSGHGLWKSSTLLLPEDAQLATSTQPFARLIDIQQTEQNMFNVPPSVQCFFIDACQEITSALIQNLDSAPGDPLVGSVNAREIPRRDAWLFLGSYTGRRAYGPEDQAPFFTQELLACLERRGAAGLVETDTWSVTTNSLRAALEAAAQWRREAEKRDIVFSFDPGQGNFTAELCQILGRPEVFVKVLCLPPEAMSLAKLYVESGGTRRLRPTALPGEWYTVVNQGDCVAGVDFDPPAALTATQRAFQASPPMCEIRFRVEPQIGGGTGGAAEGGGS